MIYIQFYKTKLSQSVHYFELILSKPYSSLKSLKTIPFTEAHTYTAHISGSITVTGVEKKMHCPKDYPSGVWQMKIG